MATIRTRQRKDGSLAYLSEVPRKEILEEGSSGKAFAEFDPSDIAQGTRHT